MALCVLDLQGMATQKDLVIGSCVYLLLDVLPMQTAAVIARTRELLLLLLLTARLFICFRWLRRRVSRSPCVSWLLFCPYCPFFAPLFCVAAPVVLVSVPVLSLSFSGCDLSISLFVLVCSTVVCLSLSVLVGLAWRLPLFERVYETFVVFGR